MEEKKVLNEEKMEGVSGGRYLAENELAARKLASKEDFLKSLKRPDQKSGEIPRELLDRVSGGEMSDTYKEYLDFIIQEAKKRGYTRESALAEMQQCGYPQEDIDYVAANW